MRNLHVNYSLRFLLIRIGDVLNSRKRILFHVLYVRDGAIQTTLCDRISRVHHHPTLEIHAITVSISGACADETYSMICHVEHVDESVSVQNIGA